MVKFRSNHIFKRAFAEGLAVVHRKRKGEQSGIDDAESDCDEIFAVIVGQLEIKTGGQWRPAPPQSFAFFPRGSSYGIRQLAGYCGPVEILNILLQVTAEADVQSPQIHRILPDLWWRRLMALDADCHYDSAGQRVLPVGVLAEFVGGLSTEPLRAKRSAAATGASAVAPRRADIQTEWLDTWAAAEELIRRRAGEGLTAAELARALDVSPTQLRRIFHAVRGEAPKTSLTRWRIDAAKKLLAAGEQSISQIAEQIGYRTVQRFSAAFKAATGKPPTAFARGG